MGDILKKINIFVCTCPNRSGVCAIDNPDRFEQDFDTHTPPPKQLKHVRRVYREFFRFSKKFQIQR